MPAELEDFSDEDDEEFKADVRSDSCSCIRQLVADVRVRRRRSWS